MEKVIYVGTDILGGTPVFCGTRVPIKNLFDYLETGETVDDFLRDFDSVKPNQAIRVLEIFATKIFKIWNAKIKIE